MMDQGFVESLGKYRKVSRTLLGLVEVRADLSSLLLLLQYDVSSLRDLLRALRNKKHHFMFVLPRLISRPPLVSLLTRTIFASQGSPTCRQGSDVPSSRGIPLLFHLRESPHLSSQLCFATR